jgi:hypothetical protein
LIILLVAVAVAAIWAFVSPALRGTGTQFTKTQVCVSNIIEPITCKTTAGGTDGSGTYPITIQVRRTLTDGVALPTEFESVVGTSPLTKKKITDNDCTYQGNKPSPTCTTIPKMPTSQGELKEIVFDAAAPSETAGSSPQAKVTTTYKLPDNTIVKCPSLPITCNVV